MGVVSKYHCDACYRQFELGGPVKFCPYCGDKGIIKQIVAPTTDDSSQAGKFGY